MEIENKIIHNLDNLELQNVEDTISTTEIIQEANDEVAKLSSENVKCFYMNKAYLLLNALFILVDHLVDIILIIALFRMGQFWFAAIYLSIDVYPAAVIMWIKYQQENSWKVLRYCYHPYNVVKWTIHALKNDEHTSFLQDIKASHLAIEAPFQVLLKLSMVFLGVFPEPGSESNTFEIEIDLSWFCIVSSIISICGMLTEALWVTEPIQMISNGLTANLNFVLLFFYRMLSWLIIITFLSGFSFIVLVGLATVNSIVFLILQKTKPKVEPILMSILSLVFPVISFPSAEMGKNEALRLLFWMALTGNIYFLSVLAILSALYYSETYNPWCSNRWHNLLIPEHTVDNFFYCALALFASATLPVSVGFFLKKSSSKALKAASVRTATMICVLFSLVIMFISIWGHEYYPIAHISSTASRQIFPVQAIGGWSQWSTGQQNSVRYRKCLDHFSIQYNPTNDKFDDYWRTFTNCGSNCRKQRKGNQSLTAADTLDCNTECLGLNCEIEYTKSDGSLVCGFYIRGHLNWHQAEQECQEYGAELPIIKSESDNKNILSVKPPKEAIWIGVSRSKGDRNNWESNSIPLTYTNWDDGEPDDRFGINEDCGMMITDSGKWHDFDCSKSLFSTKTLCEKTIKRANTGINCELKYIKSDGSFTCGFFISGRLDWHQAVKECQEYDAKLPSINSESDNKNILSVKPPKEPLWLGISRSNDDRNNWESNNLPLNYTNWDNGEPDDRGGINEDCGMMFTDLGKWHDFDCLKAPWTKKNLCEKTIACELQYTKSDGSLACGFFINGNFNWHQAAEECEEHGAKLPVINSDSDNQNILRVKPQEGLWLGISRSKDDRNVWESYNVNLTYTNWDDGEPDDRGGNKEDCGLMFTDTGKWHDFDCLKTTRATKTLCEMTIAPQKSS